MSGCERNIGDDERPAATCGKPVTHYIVRWGAAWNVEVCGEHAREALGDGCTVFDDNGDEVLPHPETNELAKVVTIEVCS